MAFSFREFLFGKPLATHGMEHQLLPKYLALPIFSSDALSSVAYATQEMMIALVVAGSTAFSVCIWQAAAIVFLLVILTASYNQTISAYPQGGGAYNVAHDNLGTIPALVAAVSLMSDYILTVAVSVSSGIDAIISTDPTLMHGLLIRLLMCMAALWFVVIMNLRGISESAKAFALPVYLFLASILSLVAIGVWQVITHHFGQLHPETTAAFREHIFVRQQQLGVFLILHSFAQGCTALTGLEAISNSTAAFREPKSRNAQRTMQILAGSLGAMLIGITYLAQRMAAHGQLVPSATGETVISQIAHAAVGNNWFYWCVQLSTFAVLVLAANTSFTGFPRLGAMVAADRFLPRQLMTLGDRLVFSNGIIVLGVVASVLIIAFQGNTDKLIPLYAIGVYMAFTLSQAGMVQRWRRLRTPGWLSRATLNAIGAVVTALVAVIFGVVKFWDGAWFVLVLIPVFTYVLYRIGVHYRFVQTALRLNGRQLGPDERPHIAIVLAHDLNDDVLAAVEYAAMIADRVELFQWIRPGQHADELKSTIASTYVDRTSTTWRSGLLQRVRTLRREENVLVTVVLSESLEVTGWARLLRNQSDLLVKLALLNQRGVVVADTRRYRKASRIPEPGRKQVRHTALVLIPSVHRGTMEAIQYARRISREVQALHIEIDPGATEKLLKRWDEYAPTLPLLVMESPYRQLRTPLVQYIRALRINKPGAVITVVVPEFVAEKWWDKVLHNHMGFILKLALRDESGIVLSNPRYFMDKATTAAILEETGPVVKR